MATPQKVKDQHYVPQGHLKKFTHDGRQLFVFDKVTGITRQTSTTDVGYAKYFYDFQPDIQKHFKDPQLIEHIFADLEPIFYKLRDELLATAESGGKITQAQKLGMAYFLMLQLMRTADHRQQLAEMMEAFGKEGIAWDNKNVSFLHASIFLQTDMLFPYVEILNEHIWVVGINAGGPHSFYTSDTPVVMAVQSNQSRSIGIGTPGIEIAFPLTSNHILILKDRATFRDLAPFDMTLQRVSQEEILYYNRLQVMQSYRQMYCASNDFALAKQICKQFPDVCNPDRKRIEVHVLHPTPERTVLHFVSPDPDQMRDGID